MEEALEILEQIEEQVNTCCAVTMYPEDVLELIDKLKNILEKYRGISSDGQSATFALQRSPVRIWYSPPICIIMTKEEVQQIVDYAYPKIAAYYGKGKLPIPLVKLSVDIFARLSGIPDMRGAESEDTDAQYEEDTNKIYVYYPNMRDEEHIIRSLIHEYTHYTQVKDIEDTQSRVDLFKKYKDMYDYDTDPTEIEAAKNEENWQMFSQK